jgi:ABC-type Fe3+-hydroxamate transport system substrate-binding protein
VSDGKIIKIFNDQMNREVEVPFPPQRIISLVPSQTELLFSLGLDDQIVGITKFCIHPSGKVSNKTKIGGTKKINFSKIHSLDPQLIIANKEENAESDIMMLMKEYPVWVSDIKTLSDALRMILSIGELTGKEIESIRLVGEITAVFEEFKVSEIISPGFSRPATVCYMIWNNPYMTIGCDTFIHEMIGLAGFQNVFQDKIRYPAISEAELISRAPQYVFLSSEPFPFNETHVEALNKILPESKIILVDGEIFSWYGSRLLKAPEYFRYLKTLL